MPSFIASTRAIGGIISRASKNQSILAGRIGSLPIPIPSSWNTTIAIKNKLIQRATFSSGAVWQHESKPRPAPGTGIKVNFVKPDGETVSVEANEGESLLDLARANDLDVEGACEASLACSTCHLILDEASFDKLEEPSDEENDMLDLAFGLTDTSRLGCQVLMTKDLEGLTAKIPSATRNMYVDGAKPKHH
ncbi:Adrenodoxin-like protein 1, mitochondrial [Linnemannia zychae]|nr:Adrenodoxin-like protein 1, mitochondrial [Linnemannia zychae]